MGIPGEVVGAPRSNGADTAPSFASPHGLRSPGGRGPTGPTGPIGPAGPGTGASRRPDRRTRRQAPWGMPLALAFIGTAAIGFNTLRVAGGPLADVIFVGAACAIAAKLLMGDTRHLATADARRAPPQFVVASLLLLTAGVLSSLWVEDPGASFTIVLRFAWLTLVWSWVLRSVVASPLALDRLVGGYRVTAVISAAAGIAGYLGVLHLEQTDGGRQMAWTAHPNHLGGLLAVGLPFFLLDTRAVRADVEGQRGRSLLARLLLSGFIVFGITTTGSMSALAAAVGGAVTVVAARAFAKGVPRRRHGPLVAIGVSFAVFLGVLGLAASGAPAIERLIGYQEGEAGVSHSVGTRGEQDKFVVDRLDKYLVVGIGFAQGVTAVQEETGNGVHNNVLKLLYESGVPAVIGLLMLWLLAARQVWRLLFNTRGSPLQGLVVALLGSFVSASLFAQFHPLAYERYYWFPLVMIGATWSLRRHQLRLAAAEGANGAANGQQGDAPLTAVR